MCSTPLQDAAEGTKLAISAAELEKVASESFILTKHDIMHKVQIMFGEHAKKTDLLIDAMPKDAKEKLPRNMPKISKGENYRRMPWVMLDHPAHFSGKDIFALRTFFWWGHGFSVQLLLTGKYLNLQQLFFRQAQQNSNLFVSTLHDMWAHDFVECYPVSLGDYTCNEHASYFKVGCTFPILEWNNMPRLLTGATEQILNVLVN